MVIHTHHQPSSHCFLDSCATCDQLIPNMSNIFAKGNPAFRDLHYTMDSLYRRLRAEGVGAEKHSAEPFTNEDKNKLWKLEIMGTHSPTSLQ